MLSTLLLTLALGAEPAAAPEAPPTPPAEAPAANPATGSARTADAKPVDAKALYAELKLSDDEQKELEEGEVVVKSEAFKGPDGKSADSGRGRAWALVKASADDCYRVLIDEYEKQTEFMPRLTRAAVEKRDEKAMRVTHDVKVVFSTYTYTMNLACDRAAHTMSWALDKTVKNDIKDTSGQWRFVPLAKDKTLIDYTVSADAGRAVPKFLEDYLTRKDLPSILDSLRKRVESGGKYKKDD